jgi:hypothetical protein
VLVVRAWLEEVPERALRARITQTLDISEHDDIVILVTSSDEVRDVVRAWLEAFVGG